MFIDSHCHLDFDDFSSNLDEILLNMKNSQVNQALCISVDIPGFTNVLSLASKYDHLYASVGVHPEIVDGRARGRGGADGDPEVGACAGFGRRTCAAVGQSQSARHRHRT